jgi:DNA-binding transcriptional regulator LsrR (DeoR family)
MAKLREAEVLEIYEMAWSSHYTQAEIAKMFGVGRECVSSIKLAKNWRWLTQTNQTKETNMTEVRYNKSHHAGGTPEARIANRLRNRAGLKNLNRGISGVSA